MSRLLALCCCLCLVSACAVGPDYKRPVIDVPKAWRLEEKEAKDYANTAWWEEFKDPVLNDLIQIALRENKDLGIATAKIEEYMGRYRIVRADLFPQVGASGSVARKGSTERGNPPLPDTAQNPSSDYQTSLYSSWELDIWGRIRRSTEASRAELLGTEEARRAVIMTLVTSVAASYTDLRHLDRQLEIARKTAKSREESFGLFKLRFERGLISQVELSQAESEYRGALATIPFFEKLIEQQENAVSLLLGRNSGPIPRGIPLDELPFPSVPAGLPSELLERRPDIRSVEQALIAANARIGVAKALYFPTIFLTGSYGVESTDLSLLFTRPSRAWSYAAPVTMPVFNAGKIGGLVEAAEAVQRQTLLKYQQTIQGAFREAEDGLIDQRKSREQLAAQKQQVEALRSYAGLARIRYDNGYTSYLEVLDAQRSLFVAELAYTQTEASLFRSLVNLYKAMGGGWVVEAEKRTGP
jgi:outer membrane protein, multidrug efflux system